MPRKAVLVAIAVAATLTLPLSGNANGPGYCQRCFLEVIEPGCPIGLEVRYTRHWDVTNNGNYHLIYTQHSNLCGSCEEWHGQIYPDDTCGESSLAYKQYEGAKLALRKSGTLELAAYPNASYDPQKGVMSFEGCADEIVATLEVAPDRVTVAAVP